MTMTTQEIISTYVPKDTPTTIAGKTISFPVTASSLREVVVGLSKTHHLPMKTMFAKDDREADHSYKICYVFGVPKTGHFLIPTLSLVGTESYPSLALDLFQTALYEPHIYEMFGLIPEGFPGKLQPVVLHDNWLAHVHPMRKDFTESDKRKHGGSERLSYTFTEVEGEGVFEVPVGPVHAGIIEPGHFRFSMAGEAIVNLEARLGWMHKGSEKLFETLPLEKKVALSERIAGDASFANSTAFVSAVESLAGIEIPKRAAYLRVIFGELERLACHFNDIGFILSDTGFNFGGAQGTRLRERIMQWNERLTGSRFLRGVNTIGGVTVNIGEDVLVSIAKEMEDLKKDIAQVIEIAGNSSIVLNRIDGTGKISHAIATDYDAVGVPARASGVAVDARIDYPYAAYADLPFPISTETTGDVAARYRVRIKEVYSSMDLIAQAVAWIPEGEICAPTPHLSLKKDAVEVGIAEAWRGDTVYVVATDNKGEISRVSVRESSWINWNLVPHAGPGNVLLDFPLINKSFNLSYTGFDK